MFSNILLTIINIIHIIIVFLLFYIPLCSNNSQHLFLHSISLSLIMLHWSLNNNICAVTQLEKYIRQFNNKTKDVDLDCFTCRIVDPVFDYKKNTNSNSPYFISSALLAISLFKLYRHKKNNTLSINI
jgi:hypothetical protein